MSADSQLSDLLETPLVVTGRILPPPRRVNGRRRYDPVVLRMLEVLRFAQKAGFTLDEIRTLFHGFGAETPMGERWRALAQDKLRELDDLEGE